MHDSLKYIHHNGRASGGFLCFSRHHIVTLFSWSFPNEPQSGVASKQRTASFGNVSSLVRHWPLSFIGRFEFFKVERTFALGTPPVQMYICTFGVRAYAPLSIWVLMRQEWWLAWWWAEKTRCDSILLHSNCSWVLGNYGILSLHFLSLSCGSIFKISIRWSPAPCSDPLGLPSAKESPSHAPWLQRGRQKPDPLQPPSCPPD